MAELLLELFSEEIPANALRGPLSQDQRMQQSTLPCEAGHAAGTFGVGGKGIVSCEANEGDAPPV